MTSFADLVAQAEKEGILGGKAETLPAGSYQMQVQGVKAGKTKKGDSSLSILWKTSDGRTVFQNLNYIPDNQIGTAITLRTIQELGVARDFLARVDVSQGLDPFVPELLRVTQGRTFNVDVTVKTANGYTNNNFSIKSGPSAAVPGSPAVPSTATVIMQPVPVVIPQPTPVPIPQPAPVDPVTGFPPRPGI